MSVQDIPFLAHALHSSASYLSPMVHEKDKRVISIDSAEFMRALSNIKELQNIILSHLDPKVDASVHKTVALFVLSVPQTIDVVFDREQHVLPVRFPFSSILEKDNFSESPSWNQRVTARRYGNANIKGREVGEVEELWPYQALLTVRSGADRLLGTGLECGAEKEMRIPVEQFDTYFRQMLFHGLREVIWGIPPPHHYFSTSSGRMVTDHYWASPQSLATVTFGGSAAEAEGAPNQDRYSFREARAVKRLTFATLAEDMLRRFSELIVYAEAVEPRINISLALMRPVPSPVSTGSSGSSGVGKSSGVPSSVLEGFLYHMDSAAREMSHLEFDAAMIGLNNAEHRLLAATKLIEEMISQRVGEFVCASESGLLGLNGRRAARGHPAA
eukprot:gene3363-4166_t